MLKFGWDTLRIVILLRWQVLPKYKVMWWEHSHTKALHGKRECHLVILCITVHLDSGPLFPQGHSPLRLFWTFPRSLAILFNKNQASLRASKAPGTVCPRSRGHSAAAGMLLGGAWLMRLTDFPSRFRTRQGPLLSLQPGQQAQKWK